MRLATDSSPRKTLLLAALATLGGLAEAPAQSLRQGFEGTTADTWAFTSTPAPYNVVALTDVWDAVPSVGTTATGTPPANVQALPDAGSRLWGMRDLENPSVNDLPTWHFLDFAPVAVQAGPMAATAVSFRFFSNGFDSADSLAYVVQFDNGPAWPATRAYTQLAKNTQAYQTVTVAIPAGSTFVRLRLAAKQNGNDDWAAWDEVQLTRATVPVLPPRIRFSAATATVNETAGTVSVVLGLANPGATASTVQVSLVAGLSTATAGADFTLAGPQTVIFPANSTNQTLTIPISDDALAEDAEYFTLRLSSPANASLDRANSEMLVYLKDNDRAAPTQSRSIRLSLLSSYQNGANSANSAEIVAHDPSTQRLYVANSVGGKLDILDFANPAAITPIASVAMAPYGGINSVAVRNGVVACAVENSTLANDGFVVFFDANGLFQKQVTVGNLPDMLTFTPDGRFLLTANEGQPADNYSADPEGSVSIIDFTGGLAGVSQASVTTVGFSSFNAQAATLRASGIRLFGGTATVPSTVAQDLEPEYIAVSADSRTAYITLQENNALAVLDLSTRQFTALRPLGFQDHGQAGFGLDASDRTADVLIAPWPVKGMRQPDALAYFTLPNNPTPYLIQVNEGDAREYAALNEQARVGDAAYVLDTVAFPSHRLLKHPNVLGRLRTTNKLGDTDGDGDFDEIYSFGSRSFTISNASTGALVHESGDMLERFTSTDAVYGLIFNASTGTSLTNAPTRKDRSDDKGPEPEGVAIGTIRDTTYAFVSLERIGGAAVFNVNDPANPRLVQYVNNRSTSSGAGDQGPEGTVFISAANSPTGRNLLLLANEVSSTVAVYDIQLRGTPTAVASARPAVPLQLYPNPVQGGAVRLSRPATGQLLDILGRPVRQLQATDRLETTGLAPGVYVLKSTDGATARLVVR